MPNAFAPQIISANDLLGGQVVYLTAENNWSARIADARIAQDADTAAIMLEVAEAQTAQVVGPYLIDVSIAAGSPQPVHFREKFRLNGPSIAVPLSSNSA